MNLKKNSIAVLIVGLILAGLPFFLSKIISFQQESLVLASLWLLGSALVLYYLYITIYPSRNSKIAVLKVLSLIGLLALVVFLLRQAGITFSTLPTSLVQFGIGQSFTCPTGAQWYGSPGCEILYYINYSGTGLPSNYKLLPPGETFTCVQGYNLNNQPVYIGCGAEYQPSLTSSSVTTTFLESGLPSYYEWSVTYDGLTSSNVGGGSITFTTPPGTYSYSILSNYPYYPSPSSGTLQAGSSLTVYYLLSSTTTTQSQQSTSSSSISTTEIQGSYSVQYIGVILTDIADSFIPIGE